MLTFVRAFVRLFPEGLVVVEVTTPPTVLLLKAPSDFDATVWVFQLNQQSQYAVVSRTQVRHCTVPVL